MAKKKKSRSAQKAQKSNKQSQNSSRREMSLRLPARLAQDLPKAHRFVAQERWEDAFTLLTDLNRKFPNRVEVLSELANVSLALKDYQSYLRYIRFYHQLESGSDSTISLAGAYLTNQYPFAAIHYFEAFLSRYPDHDRADEIQTELIDLNKIAAELVEQFEIPGIGQTEEERQALAVQHDLLRAATELIEVEEARRIGQIILEKFPTFAPALNNLSQIEYLADDPQLAIDYCQRVLQADPNNFQASGNLTRYLFLQGRVDESMQEAERLKGLQSNNPDNWIKKAEAFSYLGDDQAVLDAVEGMQQEKQINKLPQTALIYHWGGVAAARLGKIPQAKLLFKQALLIDPTLTIANENLKDLDKKVGMQNGAWPFSIHHWLQGSLRNDIIGMVATAEQESNGKEPLAKLLQPYVARNPHLIHIVAAMFERGDESARAIAAELARYSEEPTLLDHLKNFVMGQKGTDEQRGRFLGILTELNVIPRGLVKMWINGEWSDLMALGFEVGDQSDFEYSFKNRIALRKMQQATIAMQRGDAIEAITLLEQAVALEPNNPGLLNNLAGMRSNVLNDESIIIDMLHRLGREFPDYLFAQVGLANISIQDGDLENASALLTPLLQRNKLHYSEFRSLADSFIRLTLAQGKPEGAQSWLGMWEQIEPGNPQIQQRRFEVEQALKLKNRTRRG